MKKNMAAISLSWCGRLEIFLYEFNFVDPSRPVVGDVVYVSGAGFAVVAWPTATPTVSPTLAAVLARLFANTCKVEVYSLQLRRKPSTLSVRPNFLKCVQICV